MKAIPTEIVNGKAAAGNGAYVFKVDTMGRYYTFEIDGIDYNPEDHKTLTEADLEESSEGSTAEEESAPAEEPENEEM